MKPQNFLIAVLTTSAVALATFLVITPSNPPAAQASMAVEGRNYRLMAHATAAGNSEDLVTVVDMKSFKAITYQLQTNRFVVYAGGDMTKPFAAP